MPAMKQSLEEAEQTAAFAMACGSQKIGQTPPPVSISDLLQTLKVSRR